MKGKGIYCEQGYDQRDRRIMWGHQFTEASRQDYFNVFQILARYDEGRLKQKKSECRWMGCEEGEDLIEDGTKS